MKQITLAIIVVLTASTTVFGAPQFPDKIIYKGTEYHLWTYPLEIYLKKYPYKRQEGLWLAVLVRGYQATFEIKNGQLYIKDIEILVNTINTNKRKKDYNDRIWESVLNKVFPNQELVKVDWFTGLLVLKHGEIIDYEAIYEGDKRVGYTSIHEYYILLEIDNGDIKTEKLLNYEEYKQFKEKQ